MGHPDILCLHSTNRNLMYHCLYAILVSLGLSHKLLDSIYFWSQGPIHNEGHEHLVGNSLQELLPDGKLIR